MKNELMIFEQKEKAVVSSRTIAKIFEKDHFHMLRDIKSLIEGISKNGDTPKRYFISSEYVNKQNGQTYLEYLCTRDGFSLLAMGFTGQKALEWKLKYINVFNQMEAFIKERQSSEWLMTRKQGKLIRRSETDTIASLIEYSETQGSRNMRKQAYNIYSKLVNSLVGIESGQRETVSFKVISTIGFLEDMILHTIDEEMQKGTHYKQIYQTCKSYGEQIMRFAYLPRLTA
jgi:Rha family phage regulatory protein